MKLRIRLKEAKEPRKVRKQARCPLCWHGTWDTHLEKHMNSPDCLLGQRRIGLYRQGLEPASGYFQVLKKAGVPMQKYLTDVTVSQREDRATGKWVTEREEKERYWAPRWALAVCQVYEKQQRMAFFGAAVESQKGDRQLLYAELRAMMVQPPEVQEVCILEARLFFRVSLWHEEENQTGKAPAQEAPQAGP